MLIKSNDKSYSLSNTTLSELPAISKKILQEYGSNQDLPFSAILNSKNYILQDTVSENTDGLWVQEIDRKPLSIKFE